MYGAFSTPSFAVENNIPYVLLDGIMLGDAHADEVIDISDVTYIQRHAAELELLSGIYFKAADVDGNGVVDISDATTIQMFIADLDVQYPIGVVMTQ